MKFHPIEFSLQRTEMTENKRFAAAAERNQGPIIQVLREHLPEQGLVLEIASGTGQHCVAFAKAFPKLRWQPSDPDLSARCSIEAWIHEQHCDNVLLPLDLDAHDEDWGLERVDAMVCINMIHISPWSACLGMFRGASRLLSEGGLLYLYGPYRVHGQHTAPSNEAFDASLQQRDPAWGVRDIQDVQQAGLACGFVLRQVVEMPANNKSLLFRRQSGEA